ncbi:MAG: 5-formyltetrahydrofolate cyclo-ligase [Planctomycetota bacterium]|jgi:5-formyltetrahydrofolate cyclo-ligase
MSAPAPLTIMGKNHQQWKIDIRSRMRDALAAMDDRARHDASAAACSHLTSLDAFRHASVVMLYMPVANEVDLTSAALRCFRMGKTVCVPRVDWKRKDLDPVEVTSFDDEVMDTDENGERTPRSGAPLLPTMVDLVVVPGLAFDPLGHRLSRGVGYYDRFLGRLRRSATTVGLAFEVQIIESVPANEWDMSVDIVVTDRRVTHVARARSRR